MFYIRTPLEPELDDRATFKTASLRFPIPIDHKLLDHKLPVNYIG